MSSRIRRRLPVGNRWLNLAFQETAKRSPVNVRPLLLVERRRNFKGTGLFALANLGVERFEDATGQHLDGVDFGSEARHLLDWLVRNRCTGYSGFCGSHRHPIQKLDGRVGRPNELDVVSTSYAVKALLCGAGMDEEYARIAETVADFVVEDLDYRRVDGGAKIDYHLNHPDTYYTLNAAALGGRLLLDLYAATGTERYGDRGTAILDYVAGKQTDRGGWYYRDSPSASHLSMDNHHNAFIIESLLRHRSVCGSDRYDEAIERGLSFFRRELIDADGAPNFDESERYPRDVHACANSVLLSVYAGDLDLAGRVLGWTPENLYAGEGRFYFRKHRFHTKRHTLMRWCQAWMAFAMAEYLTATTTGTTHESLVGR